MESSTSRKSLTLWTALGCICLILLTVKFNSLPQDYFKPVLTEKVKLSTRFETCLSLAQSLHEVQSDLFEAAQDLSLAVDRSEALESVPRFEKAKNETDCHIQTLKYAKIKD